jgi:hypothetical protein
MANNGNPTFPVKSHFPKTLGALLLTLFAVPVALPKKGKEKSRLNLINTVYITGTGRAADSVRENLSKTTCLKPAALADDADAILEVWEEVNPCRRTLSKACQGVSGTVRDARTGKVIWYRTDDDITAALSVGGSEAAGKWILWQLDSAACKGRRSKPSRSSP